MSKIIQLKDKEFELFIPEKKIVSTIRNMAEIIRRDIEGQNPLFVGILNGAYLFAAELTSLLPPVGELTFAAYSSYRGTRSQGVVQEVLPVRSDVRGRTVFLLEDVVDTGRTMQYVMRKMREAGAGKVCLATMLFKPDALECDLTPDYIGLEIANDFVVGFGLDYDGFGRPLRDIYRISNQKSLH